MPGGTITLIPGEREIYRFQIAAGSDPKVEEQFRQDLMIALTGKEYMGDALARDILQRLKKVMPATGISTPQAFQDPKIRQAVDTLLGPFETPEDMMNKIRSVRSQHAELTDENHPINKLYPDDIDAILVYHREGHPTDRTGAQIRRLRGMVTGALGLMTLVGGKLPGGVAPAEGELGAMAKPLTEADFAPSATTAEAESATTPNAATKVDLALRACFRAGTPVSCQSGFRAIETVGIGQRVTTCDAVPGRRIDPLTHRVIHIEFVRDGQEFLMSFLRSANVVGCLSPGDTIDLSVFELRINGPARVLGVDPCPPIEEGEGRLVTGTFHSETVDLYHIKIEGLAEPLEVTGNHPVFSADKEDFVPARSLRSGSSLRTQVGVAVVEWVAKVPGVYKVFNLEIDATHRYFVTRRRVLVHNAGTNEVIKETRPEVYEVGLAKDLRANPLKGTEVNHAPQSRQAESLVGGFNAANDVGNEPAIRLPISEHQAVTAAQSVRTVVPASARDLLADEIRILRNNTNAPNSALQQLIEFNRAEHPYDYAPLNRMETP